MTNLGHAKTRCDTARRRRDYEGPQLLSEATRVDWAGGQALIDRDARDVMVERIGSHINATWPGYRA